MPKRIKKVKTLRILIIQTILILVGCFYILIVIGNGIFSYRRTKKYAITAANEVSDQIVTNYNTQFNSVINSFSFVEIELLNAKNYMDVEKNLEVIKGANDYISNIVLYDIAGHELVFTGLPLAIEADKINQDYSNQGYYNFSSPYMENGRYIILIGKGVSYYDNGISKSGVLLVECDFQTIVNVASDVELGEGGFIYLLDKDNTIFYTLDKDYTQEHRAFSNQKIEEMILGNELVKYKNTRYSLYVQTISNTRWKIAICINVNDFFHTELVSSFVMLIVAIAFFGIAYVLAYYLAYRVTNPLEELEESMKKIEKGDFTVSSVLSDTRQAEINKLNDDFNTMIARIRELMDEIVEQQKAKRASDLKALQNQINPHFLYNTLDSIVSMAEMNKTTEVKTMVVALARYFRISISKGKMIIPVEEELEHIKNYMIIQSIRYGDTFLFHIDCDEDCKELPTMKLMLQPFVENSIYHGLKNLEEQGSISIRVYKDTQYIYFEVKDNGYGIKESKIEELYENMRNPNVENSVGIKNVYQRLKLYFGERSDIVIESSLDEYTKFIIKQPLEGEVEA